MHKQITQVEIIGGLVNMDLPEKERYFIRSLAKGLNLLKSLADAKQALTLSEIAQALGTNNASATRLCYTLEHMGFIRRDKERKFHLTPNVLKLGYSAICELEWRDIAMHYLEELFEEVQENISLSVLDGSEILYLIRLRKNELLPFTIRIGSRFPAYCTGMGKVLLAMGPKDKTQDVINSLEFSSLTPHTIAQIDKFKRELDLVRKKGYAINYEELSLGACAVAAPVLDNANCAFAAISIAVSTVNYKKKDLEKKLIPSVLKTSRKISDALQSIDLNYEIGS